MPKVTVEFNLPDERDEYKTHTQALDMSCCLFDIYNDLRSLNKYGHAFKDADDAVEKIYEMFWEKVNEHGIELL